MLYLHPLRTSLLPCAVCKSRSTALLWTTMLHGCEQKIPPAVSVFLFSTRLSTAYLVRGRSMLHFLLFQLKDLHACHWPSCCCYYYYYHYYYGFVTVAKALFLSFASLSSLFLCIAGWARMKNDCFACNLASWFTCNWGALRQNAFFLYVARLFVLLITEALLSAAELEWTVSSFLFSSFSHTYAHTRIHKNSTSSL